MTSTAPDLYRDGQKLARLVIPPTIDRYHEQPMLAALSRDVFALLWQHAGGDWEKLIPLLRSDPKRLATQISRSDPEFARLQYDD